MKDNNTTSKVRPIAFYLPQFYPTPENDEWWEPGFTEWTNVAKAKPLYKGHYQPRIPRDLGFYDLRVPETREKQAQLAREAGIEGFCYWHYWFAGRRLLDKVFAEVVESGKPDFPFCLCWANHSWYKKTWQPDVPDQLLVEQTYPGEQDFINHFYAMLPAFRDKRYMKVDGKLIFGVFAPHLLSSTHLFFDVWNDLAKRNNLGGFYFFGLCQGMDIYEQVKNQEYDAIVFDPLYESYVYFRHHKFIGKFKRRLSHFNIPCSFNYEAYANYSIDFLAKHPNFIPCLGPDFDHSPRSGYRYIILDKSSPQKWGSLCKEVKDLICRSQGRSNLFFIKAWNEWGEGNYLEPDEKWGRAYLDATRDVFFEGL